MLNVSWLHVIIVILHLHDAAKKHHEYLAQLEKEESSEAKAARLKSSRVKQ